MACALQLTGDSRLPLDLVPCSIGKFPDQEHEEVQRLVRRAEETVLACGKLLGSFSPNANPL